ncbi:uncharacterized protein [Miscanthus floridulus]|uniref:uncharacterized protein n=1 Tax=Miscanthus floridulus TaxID=154761 RepID=UPI00345A0962
MGSYPESSLIRSSREIPLPAALFVSGGYDRMYSIRCFFYLQSTAAVQGEIDELRKRSEEAEEKLARTQKEMEEYKKLTEINNKAMEENNTLLKRILAINNASST